MAASPVSVVVRTPNAPPIIRPPARPGAFLQTLRTLTDKTSRSPQSPGAHWPAESKSSHAERLDAIEPDKTGRAEPLQTQPEGEDVPKRPEGREDPAWDMLEPSCRALAALVPMERVAPAPTTDRCSQLRAASLEQLFGALVKRVAWSTNSDRSSATLRLEIGAGELAGATVLITADPRELSVVLDAPPGVDLEAWKNRLSQRLASKGLVATFS